MRIRITFEKTAAMRYTGHLDLHRAWERMIRRARLPLAYSQGFNPHPRINLASALPLGFTSQQEVIDIWLEKEIPPAEIEQKLSPALPPGIRLSRVEEVDSHLPALQSELEASEYLITCLDPIHNLDQRIQALLAEKNLPRMRRGKDYDLRALIYSLEALPLDADGHSRMLTRLAALEGATGRPEELVEALGIDPFAVRVHRLRLNFRWRLIVVK